MLLTPSQLRAGRVIARLGIRELASETGLSTATIASIEGGGVRLPRRATQEAVRRAFESHGVEIGGHGWIRDLGDRDVSQEPTDGPGPGPCPTCVYVLDIIGRVHELFEWARDPAASGVDASGADASGAVASGADAGGADAGGADAGGADAGGAARTDDVEA